MTTFWKSNPRQYCEACGCWIDAKPSQIKKHEEGFRHKGNVIRRASKAKREKFLAQKEANKHSEAFAAIERAAKHQYVKDCANGTASFNPKNRSSHSKRRKDKPSFLPSDDEQYYYLDKLGTTHGPYSSSTMVKWYHFGFFVGALRIRKRTQSEFIHLKNIEDPFNYSEFLKRFHFDARFKKNVLEWIDISDASTVPPGIEIPQSLKNDFFKMYPKRTEKKQPIKGGGNDRFKQHQYYSTGTDFKPKKVASVQTKDLMNGRSHKEQRQLFIRGQMRKYKAKCNCGDSDCHLKHNRDVDEEDKSETTKVQKVDSNKEDKPKNANVDEFGFGKWESVTKEEFDAKHSNAHLLKAKNKRKRWWRDQINANVPSAKRKRLMGIEQLGSDEEGDYDEQYGFGDLIRGKEEDDADNIHQQYKQSTEKIAISIGSKLIVDKDERNGDDDEVLNEEDVLVRDAKLKLKALREKEMEAKMKKEEKVIEELDEYVNERNENQIDEELRIRQQVNGSKDGALFKKKKKKKKKRQRGNIGIDL